MKAKKPLGKYFAEYANKYKPIMPEMPLPTSFSVKDYTKAIDSLGLVRPEDKKKSKKS